VLDAVECQAAIGSYNRKSSDCGRRFSSAVVRWARLGAGLLDNAALKYEGLTYTENLISEAQERMVLPPCRKSNWDYVARTRESERRGCRDRAIRPTGRCKNYLPRRNRRDVAIRFCTNDAHR